MKLNYNRVSLKISAGRMDQFPKDPRPQIAFSGRSNVGKSSLINTLVGQKSLARVSSAPGKTITINFYDMDGQIYLVDLPGYGYAKRSGDSKAGFSSLTDGYFTKNPAKDKLCLTVQLIDVRVGPTDDDIMMINYLIDHRRPFVVVATKTDKFSKTALKKQLEDLHHQYFEGTDISILPFSSVTKEGKDELWRIILQAAESKAT